jgi:EmrB/QacA subfamily drug resistance transporter
MGVTAASDEAIDPATRRLVWVLVLGALAPALDTTIVNVGLSAVGGALHATVETSQWILTGYLLAMGMAMPVTRWLSERFGDKRVWLGALAVFLAGSMLAGVSWDIGALIVFRLVQGAAAGVLIPLLTSMTIQAAGRQRLGRAMTIAMLVIVVVPIFGPVAGGLIVKYLGWRWMFYLNLPLCLVAMAFAAKRIPSVAVTLETRPLDVRGLALLSPALALLIYGLSRATGQHGFAATVAWVPMAGGLLLIAGFAVHALRVPDGALIDVRLMRIRSYTASLVVLFLAGLSVYGPLLLIALYYQQVQGRSVIMTGLLLAPQGIGSLIPRGIAGKLTDRIGPRPVVLAGLLLTGLGTVAFAWAGPSTSGWLLAAALFIRGAGLAPVTIAVMAGSFRDIPHRDVPDASSTSRIIQQVGGSFGSAALALILADALTSHHAATAAARALAFHTAFRWSVALTALAIIPALLLPADKPPAVEQDTMVDDRADAV